jgi:malonyl-CoA O-methyltransferase
MRPSLTLCASKTAGMIARLLRNESRPYGRAAEAGRGAKGPRAWPAPSPGDHPAAARALAWIRGNECAAGGIRVHSRHCAAYAEVTGYTIPTLLAYGEIELAARCARWLMGAQAEDGSYADPDHGQPYVFDTGQALRGLLAVIEGVPGAARTAERAAAYLCAKAKDEGRMGFDVPYPESDPLSTHLYVLAPLLEAAEIFQQPRWREIAVNCFEHYIQRTDAIQINTLTHDLGYELEALIELGRCELATPVLMELAAEQREDGSLRGAGGQTWVCTPGLAQIAVCWYKIGHTEPANRALRWLEQHQLQGGSFLGSYGSGAAYFPYDDPAWAVKFYLDAHRLRAASPGAEDGTAEAAKR